MYSYPFSHHISSGFYVSRTVWESILFVWVFCIYCALNLLVSTTETLGEKSSLKRICKTMLKFWATYVHPEKSKSETKVRKYNSCQVDSPSSVKLLLRTDDGINTVNRTFGLCIFSKLNYSGNTLRPNVVIFKPLSASVETWFLSNIICWRYIKQKLCWQY